jgi:hypothetical protein
VRDKIAHTTVVIKLDDVLAMWAIDAFAGFTAE